MKKELKKKLKITAGIIVIGFLLLEGSNVFVDVYNFSQLKKSIPILESIGVEDRKFYSLEDFNDKYDAGIKPIKNCYSVSNDNGSEKYIFGFKLESILYTYLYKASIYAYPKYNKPVSRSCLGAYDGLDDLKNSTGKGCIDQNQVTFERIISNKCSE